MVGYYYIEFDGKDGKKYYLNEGDGASPWTITNHENLAKKYNSVKDAEKAASQSSKNLVYTPGVDLNSARIVEVVKTKNIIKGVKIGVMY